MNLFLRKFGSEEGALHGIHGTVHSARLVEMQMVGRECSAEGAAGVPRRGLDPNVVEQAFAQDLAICHAVERDAAGKTEVSGAIAAGEVASNP